ncbi:MAG TPA: arsenate reductase ArsC [Patescibacteria group bacterium]|nr:arsenate reductase ArsC [Patescibacteria group bacterium]
MKPKVLFLCTGNSARSQIAEGLLRHLAGDRFEAMSAGTDPQSLNPLAVEVMREEGLDISSQRSKSVTQFLGQPVQFVVTVCSNAKEKCPIFPATFKVIHWDLEDPAAAPGSADEKLPVFRKVRDQIRERIVREFK